MRLLLSLILFFFVINLVGQFNLNLGTIERKKYYQEIDFKIVHDKIIIEAEINGKISKFILDTGAPLCISKEEQTRNQFKLIDEDSIIDANGNKKLMQFVNVDEIKIGNTIYRNIPAVVVDFKETVLDCFGTNGLIGSNLLRFGAIQLDWKKQTLIMTNSYKRLNLKRKQGEKLLINKVQSAPYLSTYVNGKITDRLLIDTGSSDFYSLNKKGLVYIQSKGYLKDEVMMRSIGSASIGLLGSNLNASNLFVKLKSFELGKLGKIRNTYTITTNDDQSRIGNALLKQGKMTIDYRRNRFFFEPYENELKNDFNSFGIGFVFIKGQLFVGSIWENTEAYQKEFRLGDQITEIEGFDLKDKSMCELFFQLKNFLNVNNTLTFHFKKQDNETIKKVNLKKLEFN